jgi:hypothetical protein
MTAGIEATRAGCLLDCSLLATGRPVCWEVLVEIPRDGEAVIGSLVWIGLKRQQQQQ